LVQSLPKPMRNSCLMRSCVLYCINQKISFDYLSKVIVRRILPLANLGRFRSQLMISSNICLMTPKVRNHEDFFYIFSCSKLRHSRIYLNYIPGSEITWVAESIHGCDQCVHQYCSLSRQWRIWITMMRGKANLFKLLLGDKSFSPSIQTTLVYIKYSLGREDNARMLLQRVSSVIKF
jgi:hypothetical protein